jgi:hypothetical protein
MEQVVEEIDLWQTARHLIMLHGLEAQMDAIMRSERARLDGDFLGYKTWKDVSTKIWALQRQRSSDAELN